MCALDSQEDVFFGRVESPSAGYKGTSRPRSNEIFDTSGSSIPQGGRHPSHLRIFHSSELGEGRTRYGECCRSRKLFVHPLHSCPHPSDDHGSDRSDCNAVRRLEWLAAEEPPRSSMTKAAAFQARALANQHGCRFFLGELVTCDRGIFRPPCSSSAMRT